MTSMEFAAQPPPAENPYDLLMKTQSDNGAQIAAQPPTEEDMFEFSEHTFPLSPIFYAGDVGESRVDHFYIPCFYKRGRWYNPFLSNQKLCFFSN